MSFRQWRYHELELLLSELRCAGRTGNPGGSSCFSEMNAVKFLNVHFLIPERA